MNFDIGYEEAVGCGPYNYVIFFLLTFQTFQLAMEGQGLNFALYRPSFTCDTNETRSITNESIEISPDQCLYRVNNSSSWNRCTKWNYETSQFRSSMITELDLVCSKEYYRDIIYIMSYLGIILNFPISLVSDKVGRRYFLLTSLFMILPITIAIILSYNLYVLLALWLILGLINSIVCSLTITTLVELTTIKYREIAITNFWTFYTIGYIATVGLGYVFKTWRMIYVLSTIPTVVYLLYICFIPESPRWLLLKGRKAESFKILTFITRINKRTLLENDFHKWNVKEEETGNIWKLFRTKRMIGRCQILTFIECSFNLAYMGSYTDLTFASNNIFISSAVMSIIELPTGPFATFLSRFFGRRRGVIIGCVIGIICLVVTPFIESDITKSSWQPWCKVAIAMGAKFGFNSAWCVLDMYDQELIPTTHRNGALSIIYVSVGICTVIAPSIHDAAGKMYHAAPCLIYASLLIISIVLVVGFLPETRGEPLSETLEQAMSIGKRSMKIHDSSVLNGEDHSK